MYTFIRQDTGLEPQVPYSGTKDNPVQWIQFLHTLDHPDLLGLPLITPVKFQTLKCEKCSLEFCSLINYRRHCRIHRRSLKDNKESHSFKGLLAQLWDKCSLTERKQIVSYDDIALKKITGSSVVEALATALLNPGIWTHPQNYWKAGTKLLDIIQARSPVMSISSEELFSILNDASEGTFLCTGSAEYVQNFVFDGDVASGLEFRNLIASTSFLFELQLLKAWVAYKDAEALRCQKLLVEEEEAAQKRQAKLLQRRKQKKLRQKELKVKERINACKEDVNSTVSIADEKALSEESTPSTPSECSSCPVNGPADRDIYMESVASESKDSEECSVLQVEIGDCVDQRQSETFGSHGGLCGHRSDDLDHGYGTTSPRGSLHSLLDNQNTHLQHDEVEKSNMDFDGPPRDSNSVESNESEDGDDRCGCKVLIGSIPVSLNSSTTSLPLPCPSDAEYEAHAKPTALDGHASEKSVEDVHILYGSPNLLNIQETGCKPACEVDGSPEAEIKPTWDEIPSRPAASDVSAPPVVFSAATAKDFLAQRWKQAISSDHIRLSLGREHGLHVPELR